MIIDCHTHIGKILDFNMPEDMFLESLDKYEIDFALVSNIEGCEVDHAQNDLPVEEQYSQMDINEKVIGLARRFPNRIGALLWIKPRSEGCTKDFVKLIEMNRPFIYGIKVHPYLSKTPFNDPSIMEYLRVAMDFDLPIVTHTADDEYSHPDLVCEVAVENPKMKIVLCHLGLGTDNERAIRYIKEMDNLYGDISWVESDKVIKAIKECGSNKILFGTQNPMDGPDTYNDENYYAYCFERLKNEVSPEEYSDFMHGAAKRLFKIDTV